MDSSVSPKDEIWFLHVSHHISNAVYHTESFLGVKLLDLETDGSPESKPEEWDV
jgi:hypothetical protein